MSGHAMNEPILTPLYYIITWIGIVSTIFDTIIIQVLHLLSKYKNATVSIYQRGSDLCREFKTKIGLLLNALWQAIKVWPSESLMLIFVVSTIHSSTWSYYPIVSINTTYFAN